MSQEPSVLPLCRISIPFSIVTPTTRSFAHRASRRWPQPLRDARSKSECATGLRGRPALRDAGRYRDRSARRCRRRPKQHSASATASPPSLRSCADSARPAATISRIALCTRFSYSMIERRRQAPKLLFDFLNVLCASTKSNITAQVRYVRRSRMMLRPAFLNGDGSPARRSSWPPRCR